jgi:hypothetical protein
VCVSGVCVLFVDRRLTQRFPTLLIRDSPAPFTFVDLNSCYVSVLAVSCYLSMSVICWYMIYVSYMLYVCYMYSLGGVVRVRLYIIYAHLCNHILL